MKINKIDTRHGTANQSTFSHGNCLPYTGFPWGMNYFAPSTGAARGAWWFHPEDRTFEGYRITHQPSPWMGDFSHLTMTPVAGPLPETSLWHTVSSYRPEESTFNPTQLKITQLRYQITSQLIPSMYGGILSMNYQNLGLKDNGLMLHLPGSYELQQLDDYSLELSIINFAGCEDENFTFYLKFTADQPFVLSGNLSDEDSSVRLDFKAAKQVQIHFATSFISKEQAALNLEREQDNSAETYLENAESAWNNLFSRI